MKTLQGKLAILFLFNVVFFQCTTNTAIESTKVPAEVMLDSVSLKNSSVDSQIKYAKNFSITNQQNYKIVHIHYLSEQRGLDFSQKIIFLPKGTPKPKLPPELKEAWIIEVPIKTVAANEDGEITRLKTLGLVNQIIAMGGGGIYDEELRQRWENKQIASIGYSFHRPPQPEMLLTLNPDVLLLHTKDPGRLEGLEKMRDLGINAIPQFAWAEPTFLGKAEWLKFTALFFNKEKEADKLFEGIVKRCHQLSQLVENQPIKTKVFMNYFPSSLSDWTVHRNDFYASFLESSGAENLLKDNGPTHTVGMNNETLLALAKDADVWIVNSTSDKDWPPANYLNSFKAYRDKQVYHYQKRTRYEHDAYDWYETPEVRPDLVLADLVAIFYPQLLPNHRLQFLDKVHLTKL